MASIQPENPSQHDAEGVIEALILMFQDKKLSYAKICRSTLVHSIVLDDVSGPIQRTLESLRHVELGLNTGISADNDLIFRLTPNHKYWKFVESSRCPEKAKSMFWELPLVKALVSDVLGSKKDLFSVASQLGVSSEMICSNIVKSQIPHFVKSKDVKGNTPIPLKRYPTFKNHKYTDFWNERAVKSILDEIRSNKLSMEEGSAILGVKLKKLRSKIGLCKSPPKQLPKNSSALETAKVSPYEEIRNQNINERKNLLQEMSLCLSQGAGNGSRRPRKYNKRRFDASRRPSGRIQMKKPSEHSSVIYSLVQSTSVSSALTPVPPVPHMDLDEFFVHHIDYQKGKRLLGDLMDSLKEVGKVEKVSGNDDALVPSPPSMELTQFSECRIEACDIIQGPTGLIATGNKHGEVGIGRSNENILSFRVHSDRVSTVSFNWCSGKPLLLSSGCDGYLRGLDLTTQKLEIFYQWSYHHSTEKEILWHRQISEVEILLGFERSTYIFDVRSGKREISLPQGNGFPIGQNMANRHLIAIPSATGFQIRDVRVPTKDYYALSDLRPVRSVLFDPLKGTDLLINFIDRSIAIFPNWLEDSQQQLRCIVNKRRPYHTDAKWAQDSLVLFSNAKTHKRKKGLLQMNVPGERHLGFPNASSIYVYDTRANECTGEICSGISESIVEIYTDVKCQRVALGNCAGKGTIGFLASGV